MWTSFGHISPPIIEHLRDRRTTGTNRSQPWLYGTIIHWSDSGHIGQGHVPAADPTLSGCQGRETPTPRKVAHPRPNSTEVSSSDGGNQCNGDHCFLRGRIDIGGYWWPPTYSNWLLLSIFSSTHSSILFCNYGFYTSVDFWSPTHVLGGY